MSTKPAKAQVSTKPSKSIVARPGGLKIKQVAEKTVKYDKDLYARQIEIYALIDPRDGAVRYIGKSVCAARRFKQHLRETRRDFPVYRWIAKLRSVGVVPTLRIECACGPDAWRDAERDVIARERAVNSRLLNVAGGGDEPFCSTEIRAKNGVKVAASRASNPLKRKVWQLKQAIGTALKAGKVAEATRVKLRYLAARVPSVFGEYASL